MRLQTKYIVLKATTIFFGALSIPWSTFTGFCFGDGRYSTGLISLAAQTAVALIDGYIWFWVLENMKNKIQGDAQPAGVSLSSRESCPLLSRERNSIGSFQSEYPVAIHYTPQQEDSKPDLVAGRLKLNETVEPSR